MVVEVVEVAVVGLIVDGSGQNRNIRRMVEVEVVVGLFGVCLGFRCGFGCGCFGLVIVWWIWLPCRF